MMRGLIHTTKDGRQIPLRELDDKHLLNIIRRNEQLAREGLLVCWGTMTGPLAEDIDADMDWLYGDSALQALNHEAYIREAQRRGLLVAKEDK